MSWHEIRTQSEADELLELFGGFHDGLLREVHVWTSHWVGEDLAMRFDGSDLAVSARLLIQRQFRPLSAVELLFEQVTRINVVPSPPGHDSIIFSAALVVRDDLIYWAEEEAWTPEQTGHDRLTWVAGRRLRWRDGSNLMGPQVRYGSPAP